MGGAARAPRNATAPARPRTEQGLRAADSVCLDGGARGLRRGHFSLGEEEAEGLPLALGEGVPLAQREGEAQAVGVGVGWVRRITQKNQLCFFLPFEDQAIVPQH